MSAGTSRRGFVTSVAAPLILGAQDKAGTRRPVLGSDDHTYEAIHDWGDLPPGIRYGNTHGVVEDSQGRIYVHHTVNKTSERHDSMVVFDGKGKFVKAWGKEFEGGAHGLHINEGRQPGVPLPLRHAAGDRGEDDPRRRRGVHAPVPEGIARLPTRAGRQAARSTARRTWRSGRMATYMSATVTGRARSTSTTRRASSSAPSAARAKRPASSIARTA